MFYKIYLPSIGYQIDGITRYIGTPWVAPNLVKYIKLCSFPDDGLPHYIFYVELKPIERFPQ